MKKEKDKELDNVFRKGLRDPVEAEYREQDWNALEQMLDRSNRRGGLIFWLPILSSAAVLLIAFGWWVLRPDAIRHTKQKPQPQIAMRQPRQNHPVAVSNVTAPHKALADNTHASTTAAQPKLIAVPKPEIAVNTGSNHIVAHNKAIAQSKPGAVLVADKNVDDTGVNDSSNPQQSRVTATLVAFAPALNIGGADGQDVNSFDVQAVSFKPNPVKLPVANRTKIITKRGLFSNPQYAIRVLGAPEVNGVGSLSQTSSGANFGVLFSAGVKRLTLSTGALYAIKPYNAYFGNYTGNQFTSNLTSINADCRVLDIPINLNFQLYHKYRNSFSIGSGLSSYIMLHESYQYNYSNPAIYGPVNYTVPNTDKYIFGVLNLQATYTRQVTSSVGLSFEPYMKLPLTGIGANEAKLQTAGVAIGLSWNLNSTSKP